MTSKPWSTKKRGANASSSKLPDAKPCTGNQTKLELCKAAGAKAPLLKLPAANRKALYTHSDTDVCHPGVGGQGIISK